MSPLAEDVGGSVDRTTGALTITTTQRTAVYLISLGDVPHPCPRCVSGVCTDGAQRHRLHAEHVSRSDQPRLSAR